MEKHHLCYTLSLSIIVSLALIAFVSCVAAELHRTKTNDLKLDGKLCYLPESRAFGYGVAALACLVMAQVIGNILLCTSCNFNLRKKKSSEQSPKRPNLATIFLLVSWASFTVVILLLSAASSMSRRQPYAAGWLGGECYLVKSGVYVAAAVLILISTCSTVGSAVTVQINKSRKSTALPK
ncbi:protein MODIFYING WALL LIGNIN-2-like [Benincasa hispida]|uniref:protein MODIFYING WALL LIGNIN-2-like n=1 Tax=Benincasa hispida TaxID=102211 RepID=UPI0019000A29|nr:protein MODIFYING WALL LIGNIN-2-like [Benincasa hispida]